jgi:oligopeptide/dipeptide ABC transporter ATP-binding protein
MHSGEPGSEPAPQPLVVVDDLSVSFPAHYGNVAVLDRVSFTLDKGETLGIVGESGSGKTLLGQAILGLLPKTARISGRITVAGIDVLHAPRKELNRLRGGIAAPVFQDALISLNPNLTIGHHFADVWKSAGLSPPSGWREAAERSLHQVALRDPARVLRSYPFELSGGMRQRSLIALALLRQPALLVADEPTTALDRLVGQEVLGTLDGLQRDLGLTVILISHDLDVIKGVCGRTAIIYAGQLCEVGPTAEVLTRPLHRYTTGLIDGIRSLQHRQRPIAVIPGIVPSPQELGPGCRFLPRCQAGTEVCAEARPITRSGSVEAWCNHPNDRPIAIGSLEGAAQ